QGYGVRGWWGRAGGETGRGGGKGRERRGACHGLQAHYGIGVLGGLRRQAAIAKCNAWADPIHTKSVHVKWPAKPASTPTTESSGQASGRCRSGARSVTPRAKSTWRGRPLTPRIPAPPKSRTPPTSRTGPSR